MGSEMCIRDSIDTLPEVDAHIIVTNHRFAPVFQDWLRTVSYTKPITVIDDGTSTNETRLGAVRDLLLAIDREHIDDDIMVLAADNILEFPLRGFVDYFKAKDTSVIMCHEEPDIRRLQRTGVIEVDSDMRVLRMQEKPEVPASHWAVPPFYIYSRRDLPLIKASLQNGCGRLPFHRGSGIRASALTQLQTDCGIIRFGIRTLRTLRFLMSLRNFFWPARRAG